MKWLKGWLSAIHDINRKFSQAVSFSQERSKSDSKSEAVGNNCLLGQIASFMENLHLSYDEVMYKIPYRNMVIMQKDKLHTVSGEIMEEVSEEEYFRIKGKTLNKQ